MYLYINACQNRMAKNADNHPPVHPVSVRISCINTTVLTTFDGMTTEHFAAGKLKSECRRRIRSVQTSRRRTCRPKPYFNFIHGFYYISKQRKLLENTIYIIFL